MVRKGLLRQWMFLVFYNKVHLPGGSEENNETCLPPYSILPRLQEYQSCNCYTTNNIKPTVFHHLSIQIIQINLTWSKDANKPLMLKRLWSQCYFKHLGTRVLVECKGTLQLQQKILLHSSYYFTFPFKSSRWKYWEEKCTEANRIIYFISYGTVYAQTVTMFWNHCDGCLQIHTQTPVPCETTDMRGKWPFHFCKFWTMYIMLTHNAKVKSINPYASDTK
jgi:hypothetical protein